MNERYVAVSYGRDFRDATPLRGTFKGSGGQIMTVKVTMKRRKSTRGEKGRAAGSGTKGNEMRIKVVNRWDWRYESPVSFSPHIFRLFPKSDRFVSVLAADFTTNEEADVQYRRDLFDNEIAACFYPEKVAGLKTTLVLELELRERNPFHFILESHALDFPFQYKPREIEVLAPFLKTQSPAASASLPFWKPEKQPVITALIGLNDSIRANLAYERRDEGVARDPADTLALGAGSCRDFSWILADTLRANGVAARLASGLPSANSPPGKNAPRGRCTHGSRHTCPERAGSAWTPTNGVLTNENHITAATGLLPGDIAPQQGSYYYDKTPVPYTVDASLEMTLCPK